MFGKQKPVESVWEDFCIDSLKPSEPHTSYWHSEKLQLPRSGYSESDAKEAELTEANLEGSLDRETGLHSIVLDLDCKHEYRPSTTPGHAHLVIPAGLTWEKYEKLLATLAEVGVIEYGYYEASRRAKGSFVRLPHIKKLPAVAEELADIEQTWR